MERTEIEMGLCPFYFSLQNNKKIHVKADI